MVQTSSVVALGVFLSIADVATAYVAPRLPVAQVTPPPVSPFDLRSESYGRMVQRDDKKDDQKPITANWDKSTCGFVSGDASSSFTCKDGGCFSQSSFWDCSSANELLMTACTASTKVDSNADVDDGALSCTNKDSQQCFTWLLKNGKDTLTRYGCAKNAGSSLLDVVGTPKSTSVSSTTTTTTSSSSSSTSASTTTATATTTTATPSATASAAQQGLASYAIAGIVVGAILGGLAIIAILYHFISNKIKGDDHSDEMPLMENKNMNGPFGARHE